MKEQRIALAAMFVAIIVGLAGCAPRVRVTANPKPGDQGIRYYRPKPYLKVVPAEVQVGKDASKVEASLVSISLEYLPDFSEEYAIDVRSGVGIADVSIKLEDGWNLTEISQDLDSQTDENISAVGDLVKAVSGIIPTAAEDSKPVEFKVAATDVPLGYYESVIGKGPDGKKRLYGFRYLGFLPYESCPITMTGGTQACCADPSTGLYGLTFEDGRMVFKRLAEMSITSTARDQATTTNSVTITDNDQAADIAPSVHVVPLGSSSDITSQLIDESSRNALALELETVVLAQLQQSHPDVQRVTATWKEQRAGIHQLAINVHIDSVLSRGEIESEVRSLVAQVADGKFLYTVGFAP